MFFKLREKSGILESGDHEMGGKGPFNAAVTKRPHESRSCSHARHPEEGRLSPVHSLRGVVELLPRPSGYRRSVWRERSLFSWWTQAPGLKLLSVPWN